MKKIFLLSMPICFAVICACQKQDSAAEQRVAQREAVLDAREKALNEREKTLTEMQRALVNSRVSRPQVQSGRQISQTDNSSPSPSPTPQ